MIELRIVASVWDDFNEEHIWVRHRLTRAQVEEICFGDANAIHTEATYGGRFLIIAPGRDGKLYAIVLSPVEEDTFYPVSARRASRKERRTYAAWKAGTYHE